VGVGKLLRLRFVGLQFSAQSALRFPPKHRVGFLRSGYNRRYASWQKSFAEAHTLVFRFLLGRQRALPEVLLNAYIFYFDSRLRFTYYGRDAFTGGVFHLAVPARGFYCVSATRFYRPRRFAPFVAASQPELSRPAIFRLDPQNTSSGMHIVPRKRYSSTNQLIYCAMSHGA
jgi:hypothetical protein